MILYSALIDAFYPFDIFYPDAEKKVLRIGETPTRSDGWLIIWGGADIHPSQYGRANMGTHTGSKPSIRDLEEERMLREATKIGLPVLGICRGAQLACAVAGGILAQHITGHQSSHMIITDKGDKILSSSLHHQMMYPWEVPRFEVLAHSLPSRSEVYKGLTDYEETIAAYEPEPEIIYFPDQKALAIQGHPEFMEAECPYNLYVKQLCTSYL